MATVNVTTDSNYNSIGHADNDTIAISNGAVLTINTETNRIPLIYCTTLGTCIISNNSSTVPIFIDFGRDGNNPNIRFEGGGVFETQGAWIELGISDGTAGQVFTLPTNAVGAKYTRLAGLEVIENNEIVLYNVIDDFAGLKLATDEIYGRLFTHDVATGNITFDGRPPANGAVIRIPNIQLQNSASDNRAVYFDSNSSGSFNFNITALGDQYNPYFQNCGSFECDHFFVPRGNDGLRITSCPSVRIKNTVKTDSTNKLVTIGSGGDLEIDNLVIYSSLNNSRGDMLSLDGVNGGVVRNCIFHAPNFDYGHYVGALDVAGSNDFLFEDIYIRAQCISVEDISSNNVYRRMHFATDNDSPAYSALYFNGASNITVEDCDNYPATPAAGLEAFRNETIRITATASNITITGCEFHVGDSTTTDVTNSVLSAGGANIRMANCIINGDIETFPINMDLNAINLELYNIKYSSSLLSTNDLEWADNSRIELVSSKDKMETSPEGTGVNCASYLIYKGNDFSNGYLYRVMGKDKSLGLYTEITKTGVMAFDNTGRWYLGNAGDVAEFETHVHYGITGANATLLEGSGTGNFSCEFKVKVKDGDYGAYQDFNVTNFNAAITALGHNTTTDGIQIKYKITKTVTGTTNNLTRISVDATIDPNAVYPFESIPTSLIISGLLDGDTVYVQDAAENKKLYKVSDGADVELQLPNAKENEYWKYVIKRAGYNHQSGTFKIVPGNDILITQGMTEKLQAIGGSMYTASNPASISIDFDFITPQMSIDVSTPQTSPQNIFDQTEHALVTENGMKWLAIHGTDTQFQNLGGAGSFLFHQGYIRVRRRSAFDYNAEILAFVFSTDALAVDEINGSVSVFSGTLVKDVWEAILNDYDNIDGSIGKAIATMLTVILTNLDAQVSSISGGGGDSPTVEEIYSYFADANRPDIFKADVSSLATGAQISALNNFDPANDAVALVTLVETTTTNTDMRGTDGASTVEPDNAGIAQMQVAVAALNNLSAAQVTAAVPTAALITADIDNNSAKLTTILDAANLSAALSA